MVTLPYGSENFSERLAAFCASASVPAEIQKSVGEILAKVKADGDEAVMVYAKKFDGATLHPGEFRVAPKLLAEAAQALGPAERKAILAARDNVIAYNRRSLPKNWKASNPHGAEVGENYYPLRRVGLYVPGGQVPLVSTVIMTVTLATIAGCGEIAVCTPSNSNGEVSPSLLAALHLCGVEEVYRVGGVQAIGAMAYGTQMILPVDKIFGPGNAYVCEAKRQVFGTVGVDLLPGPSEVMVIADQTARADYIAADLLAQAEHGSGREKVYFVTTHLAVVKAVEKEIEAQLKKLGRASQTEKVLKNGMLVVTADSLEAVAEVANYVAPEHLELHVASRTAEILEKSITTAGAMLIGELTPTVLGDFVGPEPMRPPLAGLDVFSAGLRVADFLRRTSVVRYDAQSLKQSAPVVAAFSKMEQLDAHGLSVEIRLGLEKAAKPS